MSTVRPLTVLSRETALHSYAYVKGTGEHANAVDRRPLRMSPNARKAGAHR